MDHRRKRTAAQAPETPATKKPTASEATAQETTTQESAASKTTVLKTTVSETALKTGNQLPTSAEIYDRIFSVLMTQMEQLQSLLTIRDLCARKIVRKMVTSIRELLDNLVELQSN